MNTIKIATYNVYADPEHYLARFRYIIGTLFTSSGPEILCLQEINEDYLQHCQAILEEHGYFFQSYSSSMPTGPYGILVAMRVPGVIKTVRFTETCMGRSFIHIAINDSIHIINTHLESMYQFQTTRNQQMKQIIEYCQDQGITERTVLCGDLNTYFHRIWALEKHFMPHVDFPTWFAIRVSKTKKTGWFDRIYTGHALHLDTQSLIVVGHVEIPSLGVHPSDHDGLVFSVNYHPK